MRIISGKFRGRRLVSFKADHIRPTTDRVKESIFNKLQGHVEGARVLDLFAGTGNLTCEAVSRGASQVDAVELSKKSIQIIRENLELLSIIDQVRVHQDDVFKFLARYEGEPYDLVFADPPFTEKFADRLLTELPASRTLGPETVVMVEASSHETVRESYPGLDCIDQRDYGDKRVTYWRRSDSEMSAAPP
jgi:16S rRNA (guanine966-N2)-methyltransferase